MISNRVANILIDLTCGAKWRRARENETSQESEMASKGEDHPGYNFTTEHANYRSYSQIQLNINGEMLPAAASDLGTHWLDVVTAQILGLPTASHYVSIYEPMEIELNCIRCENESHSRAAVFVSDIWISILGHNMHSKRWYIGRAANTYKCHAFTVGARQCKQ